MSPDITIRPITAADDTAMGIIARENLTANGLDIPARPSSTHRSCI